MDANTNPLDGFLDYAPRRLADLPAHLQPGLKRYIEEGVRPGGALVAILQNEPVVQTVARLDDDTLRAVRSIGRFLYTFAPSRCWGSAEAVAAWCEGDGLAGVLERRGR